MLIGRKLDEELIDEIEMRLIAADVGVSAASEIIDGLRKAVRESLVHLCLDSLCNVLGGQDGGYQVRPSTVPVPSLRL